MILVLILPLYKHLLRKFTFLFFNELFKTFIDSLLIHVV
jgi:hypothetical protein